MHRLSVILIGLIATSAFAQTASIVGTVYEDTGDILPLVNIVVTSDAVKTNAISNTQGQFEIRNLPTGTYTLVASYIGYIDQVIPDIALRSGEIRSVNVVLLPDEILLDPVVVTASRRPERLLEAPASVTVLEASQIQDRPAITADEHLKALPGVDIASLSLNQSSVVVRGFNAVLSDALLLLVDHRLARIPSLRFNLFTFVPTLDRDLERIEVVSGPGSAMYGPNSANGVVHMLTQSPFDSRGTTVEVTGGERNLFMGSIRHAATHNNWFGYKFSAGYFRGDDWTFRDGAEPDSVVLGRQTSMGRLAEGGLISNRRDFDTERISVETRLDFRREDQWTLILSGGLSKAVNNVAYANVGSLQIKNWMYHYVQARLNYGNLFVQGFVNASDAGDSYFLRTGDLVIDNSRLIVGQVQHHVSIGSRQRFTYGVDAMLTRPDTKFTLHGDNEERDNTNEIGAYVHSETDLSSQIKLIAAGRIDDHNFVDGLIFSPRAGVLFKPHHAHNFRVTFNRAFTSPSSLNLSLDILSAHIPSPLPEPFPRTLIAIRAQGVPHETGFRFQRDAGGQALMMSQLAPGAGYIPSHLNAVWPTVRQLLIGGSPAESQPLLAATLPEQLPVNVPGDLKVLNPTTAAFDPVDTVVDIPPLKESAVTAYEVGYKGLFANKLIVEADVYHSKIRDFISPLTVVTPNVFVNPEAFGAALQPTAEHIANALMGQGLPPEVAQAQSAAIVNGLVGFAAQVPLGVVSPAEINNDTDVILTYANFGDVSLMGADVSFAYYAGRHWVLGGNYSFVNRNFFKKKTTQPFDIALNAPRHKVGASVLYQKASGFSAQLRMRSVAGFPVQAGVWSGRVDGYTVLDLNASCALPSIRGTRISVSVQNVLNNRHREFVGVPETGRLGMVRLTYSM